MSYPEENLWLAVKNRGINGHQAHLDFMRIARSLAVTHVSCSTANRKDGTTMKKLLACALISGLAVLGCNPASTSSKSTGSGTGKGGTKPADTVKPETPPSGKPAPKAEAPSPESKAPPKAGDSDKPADKSKDKPKDKGDK